MRVTRSGFYAWMKRAPSARAKRDAKLRGLVQASFAASEGRYGSPRILRTSRRRRKPVLDHQNGTRRSVTRFEEGQHRLFEYLEVFYNQRRRQQSLLRRPTSACRLSSEDLIARRSHTGIGFSVQ
ncbi:MAG: hypothetical protein H0X67_00675 [Acidobacteria bacterium]|nr:hypothetical protein [Acidobacteriota bacterium]